MKSTNQPFSVAKRLRSIQYALDGLKQAALYEHNARIHFVAALLVFLLSLVLSVSVTEAIVLIFSIALVWITELINTSIEKALDFITTEQRPEIKFIKDVAAGAVLIAALAALSIGIIIFLPKLFL